MTDVISIPEVQTVVIQEPAAPPTIVQVSVAGPQGPAGPAGASGGQPPPVTQTFSIPATSWTMTHTFPYNPYAITRDMSGDVIEGDISYPDGTHVSVSWAGNQAGTMELM